MSGDKKLSPTSSESKAYNLIEESIKYKQVGLDQDVYGAAMFTLIFDSYELFSGADHDGLSKSVNFMRVTYVLLILLVNYILQGAMLFFIWKFVTLPSVHKVQALYKRYHEEMFEDGVINDQKFANWAEQDDICAIAFSNFWFMYFILALWWCTMLKDVRLIERLYRSVKGLGHAETVSEMLGTPEEGEPHVKVMKLTMTVRALVYICVLVPKLLISSSLLFIGTVWLSATDSYADLILNAVALEFVIAIDELIFEGMLPSSIHDKIEETALFTIDKNITPEQKSAEVFSKYMRSIGYFLMVTIGVYLFMTVGQYTPRIGVFPGYAYDIQCPGWIEQQTDWVCSAMPWRDDCFAFA